MIAVLLWGINYVIIPHGLGPFGAGPFTLIRFTLTLPVLFLLLLRHRNFAIERVDWPQLALIGLVGTAGYQAAFAAAVDATTTANAAILFSLSPIFSVLLNHISGREYPSWTNWMGLIFSFIGGLILILSDGSTFTLNANHRKGDLLMLSAALFWALAALISERCLKKYGGLKVTAWSLPSGIIGLLLLSGYDTFNLDFSSIPSSAWWAMVFSIIGATVIGVVLFYDAVPHLGTRRVMSYMYLIPVIAIFSECLISRAWLNVIQVIGVILAMFGVALTRKKHIP